MAIQRHSIFEHLKA